MKVLIDADACPVVDIAVRLCKQHGIPCLLLCDTAHIMHKDGTETLIFDKGADSVDFALINRVRQGDLVITQDYGLAAMALARRAHVINQNGLIYTDENIDSLLLARHTSRKLRNAGVRLKGPAKRTSEQDEAFLRTMESFMPKA